MNGDACFAQEVAEKKTVDKNIEIPEKNIADFTSELSNVEVKNISIFEFLEEKANMENLDKEVLKRIFSYQDKIDLENL